MKEWREKNKEIKWNSYANLTSFVHIDDEMEWLEEENLHRIRKKKRREHGRKREDNGGRKEGLELKL